MNDLPQEFTLHWYGNLVISKETSMIDRVLLQFQLPSRYLNFKYREGS